MYNPPVLSVQAAPMRFYCDLSLCYMFELLVIVLFMRNVYWTFIYRKVHGFGIMNIEQKLWYLKIKLHFVHMH